MQSLSEDFGLQIKGPNLEMKDLLFRIFREITSLRLDMEKS